MSVDITKMKIATPITWGPFTTINRLVAAPMVKDFCTEEGYSTPRNNAHYKRLAEGDWGVLVVEATRIHPSGSGFRRMLGIYSDKHVAGHAEIVNAIKVVQPRTIVGLQIVHCGHSANPKLSVWEPDRDGSALETPLLSPSGIHPFLPARSMTKPEVDRAVTWFANAAGRAKDAGYDFVMIHAAHGFLLTSFMSKYFNKRTDEYGDRMRLLLRVIEECRNVAGKNYPIMVRISAHEFLKESPASRFILEWGGLPVDDGVTVDWTCETVIPALEKAGIPWIDVSAGNVQISFDAQIAPLYLPRGNYLWTVQKVRKVAKVPISCAGKMGLDPMLMAKVIEDGTVDMISLGRPEYCDYDLPKKIMEGRLEDIRLCTSCNWCTELLFSSVEVLCSINPEFGFEAEYKIEPAYKKKNVVVVGGGPAGTKAAKILAQRGHTVTLIEKDRELGGQIALCAKNPFTADWKNFLVYITAQLKKYGVKVMTETEATADSVLKMKPDAVIIATGSVPQKPKEIPGIDQPIVLTEDEAIRKGPDELGDKVVIIGGRKWGPELALWLAEEEKKVTVLEETDGPLGIDMKDTERRFSLPIMFRDRKIQALLGVKILEVKQNGVSIQDKEGKTQFIEADNVVVALKREPNRKLVDELRGKVPELYDVGDCRQPLYVFYATHGAAHIARKI